MLANKRKYSDEEKATLWNRYTDGDQSAFTDLCEAYLPLVEIIASKNKSRLPACVEIDDLISDGFFGLADAVKKFDASKGFKFETYATSRIRGAIYDCLREYDQVSRYYRGKFKDLNTTIDRLAELLQRQPTDEEIAEDLEWDVAEVNKMKAFYINSFPVNLDDFIKDDTHESFSLAELLPDATIGEPEFLLQENDISENLVEALETLSDVESLVVFWKHYENLTFIVISERLGVKVPRVSQIYSAAMKKLSGFY